MDRKTIDEAKGLLALMSDQLYYLKYHSKQDENVSKSVILSAQTASKKLYEMLENLKP